MSLKVALGFREMSLQLQAGLSPRPLQWSHNDVLHCHFLLLQAHATHCKQRHQSSTWNWLGPPVTLMGCMMVWASSCRYWCPLTMSLPGFPREYYFQSSRQHTPFHVPDYSVISYPGVSLVPSPPPGAMVHICFMAVLRCSVLH